MMPSQLANNKEKKKKKKQHKKGEKWMGMKGIGEVHGGD
jgi:hypothetical protein